MDTNLDKNTHTFETLRCGSVFKEEMDKTFYFSYGSWEKFPFQYGYSEVRAKDREEAIKIFREFHPDINKGTINCSFIYDESKDPSSLGKCHEILYKNISYGDISLVFNTAESPCKKIEYIQISCEDEE